jgi:hypothetical protein
MEVTCGDPSSIPPLTIGGCGSCDYAGSAPGSLIVGSSQGFFTSVSGIMSESDSIQGANWYGIQLNSQPWGCTYGNPPKSTTCWQQFAFINEPNRTRGDVFMQYWLLGWRSDGSNCPSGYAPHGISDCFRTPNTTNTPRVDPTNANLASVSLYAQAKNAVGNDVATFCFSGSCYTNSNPDELHLYQAWKDVEWNIFGYCCGSTANFNSPGVSMSIQVNMWDSSANAITPNCATVSYTGEKANLNLVPPCTTASGYYTFSENN